jgi:hypothetical protein
MSADRQRHDGHRPAAAGSEILRVPRRAALVGISMLLGAASLVSFAESYRGLYLWSSQHGLHGLWAAVWPLQIDVFIAVGELALFVALADRWAARSRAAAWAITLAGLAASVAGNVGHVVSHDWASRATAAVPPLAAAAALTVGLGMLKRVASRPQTAPKPAPRVHTATGPALNGTAHHNGTARTRTRPPKRTRSAPVDEDAAEREFMAELASGAIPSIRQIRARLHVGQDRARQLREHLALVNGRLVGASARIKASE